MSSELVMSQAPTTIESELADHPASKDEQHDRDGQASNCRPDRAQGADRAGDVGLRRRRVSGEHDAEDDGQCHHCTTDKLTCFGYELFHFVTFG